MIEAPASQAGTQKRPRASAPANPVNQLVINDASSLEDLRTSASTCRSCDLWRDATQTVFGEGSARARIMVVGEQPGDQEDLAGHPFVGPAGQIFNQALQDAGVSREALYVTNAVKHFKFIVRGKRRLHQSPNVREIEVCSQWLFKEIESVQPTLIVAMGASAAQAIFQRATPVKANRGKLLPYNGLHVLITVHPSYLLRLQDADVQRHERSLFVDDLKLLAAYLKAE
jgi:DNA polymerase